MGRILQTVNLIVNAINPKQVTWRLNENGTGYRAEKKDFGNEFDFELENPSEKPEIPFESMCTDSGIPWCGTAKDEKPLTSLPDTKLTINESENQKN